MIGPFRLEQSIRLGRLPLGDAALRVRATSKTLQQPCSHAASMLYNRRGADFLCYIAASKMESLPWDMTDVLYRCATTGQNVQIW